MSPYISLRPLTGELVPTDAELRAAVPPRHGRRAVAGFGQAEGKQSAVHAALFHGEWDNWVPPPRSDAVMMHGIHAAPFASDPSPPKERPRQMDHYRYDMPALMQKGGYRGTLKM